MIRMSKNCFGKSLHIDLYACNCYKIDNATIIQRVMEELIDDVLKMERFGEPFLTRFGKGDLEGYSYCQMIQTSCVTAHFAPKKGSAYIDVFSCADYDEDVVTEYLERSFEAMDCIVDVLLRI